MCLQQDKTRQIIAQMIETCRLAVREFSGMKPQSDRRIALANLAERLGDLHIASDTGADITDLLLLAQALLPAIDRMYVTWGIPTEHQYGSATRAALESLRTVQSYAESITVSSADLGAGLEQFTLAFHA